MNNSPYKKLNRLVEIYNLLNKRAFITKQEIMEILTNNFGNASNRSVERDLKALRDDFGLMIEYKHLSGYYIDKETYVDSSKINSLMSLLETTLFRIKHAHESSFIFPEVSISGMGNEHLDDFYYAISKGYEIQMTYQGYWDEEVKTKKISPQLLKEYNQRWYAVCQTNGEQRVYSLDRIKYLRVLTDEKFKEGKLSNDIFDNVIGVSEIHLKPQKVVLQFNPVQGLYIKSLPIHKSQKIISDDKNGLTIELTVGINWELKEQIRKHGSLVEVLEPQVLVQEIKKDLKKTIDMYQGKV